jgi:COP9 signalosome complex subunit 12
MEFSTYIVQLNDAILLENGPNLAYLLRPTSPHGKDLVKEFRNPTVGDGIRFEIISSICVIKIRL